MSGIGGLINLDDAPVDCALLRRLTAFLASRGPDAQRLEAIGSAGLTHTLLRVVDDAADEQPLTLDGERWIVADARIDARSDLIAALGSRGHFDVTADAADAELILRAHAVWGEECPAHLLGDFSFAIWDRQRRRLFCARDHLGVKPFFYAEAGRTIVFSNDLDCVRLHPGVSRELHDPAIADFLLFGVNQDRSATAFRHVRRLPPAHAITWSDAGTSVRRYWTLPVDEPLHLPRAGDYAERFMQLLNQSVRDRLRTSRVSILMSGGVDSPALAAGARATLRETRSDYFLQAVTSVYDRLVPDAERHYAAAVADFLGIPIRFDVRDDEISIAQWNCVSVHTPEPVESPPAFAAGCAFFETIAGAARVVFYGEGPDNALHYEWRAYLAHLAGRRQIGRLIGAILADATLHPRVPLWSSARSLALGVRKRACGRTNVPDWVADDFAARCACRDRWQAPQHRTEPVHPVRPRGHQGFDDPRWQQLFDSCDLFAARSGTEIRHPFLDLRMLRFLLSVPAMPWCRNKLLIRRAMVGLLPPEVLRRKKTPVAASADLARVRTAGLPQIDPAPDFAKYVNPAKIPRAARTPGELHLALRPHGLNHWLRDLSRN